MHKLKAVGINIYGGGFTLGVQKHFEVLGQWEEIKLGMRTFDLNFPRLFRPLNQSEWPVKEHVGKVDLVYANPPCVPWSDASSYSKRTNPDQIGRKGKTMADRFNDSLLKLTQSTMETAIRLRPRIFISESVENAYNYGATHYAPFMKAWLRRGYAITYFLTDALIHGAPCKRRRFHFITHTCALDLGESPKIKSSAVVSDVISDLRDHPIGDIKFQHVEVGVGSWNRDPELRKILTTVPPWGRLRNSLPENFVKARPSSFVRRIRWDMPALTIVRFNHFIHPDGKRWITFREGMRLATYPDTFNAHSEIDAADAVLPIVATFLAKIAHRSITKNIDVKPEFNVVDWRPLGKPFHGHK